MAKWAYLDGKSTILRQTHISQSFVGHTNQLYPQSSNFIPIRLVLSCSIPKSDTTLYAHTHIYIYDICLIIIHVFYIYICYRDMFKEYMIFISMSPKAHVSMWKRERHLLRFVQQQVADCTGAGRRVRPGKCQWTHRG